VPKGGLCSQCREVSYCCKEHQRSDWGQHKAGCKAAAAKASKAPAGSHHPQEAQVSPRVFQKVQSQDPSNSRFTSPSPCSWAIGLDAPMQREWLVDCYRMRLDDEYAWQGDIRAGSLYDGSEATQIVQDFLLFCRLAKDRGAIPANWNWSQFLKVASEHLAYAFDKSCAREKYGRENIFSPMIGSGRSLRYTGEVIYGSSAVGMYQGDSEEYRNLSTELKWKERTPGMVASVGGKKVWDAFEQNLGEKLSK